MTRHHLGGAIALGDVVPATPTDIYIFLIVVSVTLIGGVIYQWRQDHGINDTDT